jgi:cellulose synthase/poly-beta-1,6-N-acetylglucosamine synthase-like glycosyltransferase
MKLQIIILSRDRPEYLKQAIDSVLNQNKGLVEFELVVSDNSEKKEVRKMISENYESGNFKLITRKPVLSSRKHLRMVISELSSEYAVLFHDDDVMHPDYVKNMSSFLVNINQAFSAVGCNALVFKKNFSKCTQQMHSFKYVKSFSSQSDFLSQYLFGNSGKVPFPSYMYNTKFLKKISITSLPCGKHGDVTLLCSLLNYGPIFWLPDSLMYYRLHDSNDNNVYSISNRICLLNYMARSGLERGDDLMILFRCDFWYKWFVGQNIKNIFLWRNKIVFKFLFLKSLYFMHKMIFWKGFAARIKKDFL